MASHETVLNAIKNFQMEYPDGVPINTLKLDLDMPAEELGQILLNLEDQGVVFIENEEYVKLVEDASGDEILEEGFIKTKSESSKEPSTLKISNKPLEADETSIELTENESRAYEIIKGLADDSGYISRHVLEGNLLYGELDLSPLGAYNLVMSLENKGLIKKIQLTDGEYYTI